VYLTPRSGCYPSIFCRGKETTTPLHIAKKFDDFESPEDDGSDNGGNGGGGGGLCVRVCFADYTDHQFSGVIRRLRLNGRPVQMSGRKTQNLVEVWHCSDDAAQLLITFLKQQLRFPK